MFILMNTWIFKKIFKENKFPDKCKFFSSLKDCVINEKEYQRADKVWKVFKIKRFSRIPWFVLKNWCIVVMWCFWKIH